jgi:hypothetical protein
MKNEKTLLLAVYKEGPGTQGEIKGVLDGAIGGTYQERIELMYEKLTERTASCRVSCDHIPRRSIALFRAKALLDELIAGFLPRSFH